MHFENNTGFHIDVCIKTLQSASLPINLYLYIQWLNLLDA